jgi:hypothetical protein
VPFVAPATIKGLEREAERTILAKFRELQSDLEALRARPRITTVQRTDYTARVGELVRCSPPGAGMAVLLPAARAENASGRVLLVIETPGTVRVSAVQSLVNGARSIEITALGLVELVSNGVAWVSEHAAGATPELVGATGATGETGATGASGARGERGVPGRPGEDGRHGVPGRQGSDGAAGATGPAGPAAIGVPARFYDAPLQRVIPGRDGTAGAAGAAGANGSSGPPGRVLEPERPRIIPGTQGAPGAAGAPGTPGATLGQLAARWAIAYTFSTTTTDADPGAGILRLNNATQNASTVIRADLTSAQGDDVTAALAQISSSSATGVKGFLTLVNVANTSQWIVFTATTTASPAGYRNITVQLVSSSATNPFSNGADLRMTFTPIQPFVEPLAPAPNHTFLGNVSGVTAAPVPVNLSTLAGNDLEFFAGTLNVFHCDFTYEFDTSSTAGLGTALGQLRCNNSNITLVTSLFIHSTQFGLNSLGTANTFLTLMDANTPLRPKILLQQQGNSSNWALFELPVSGSVSTASSVVTVAGLVFLGSSAGAGLPWSDAARLHVRIFPGGSVNIDDLLNLVTTTDGLVPFRAGGSWIAVGFATQAQQEAGSNTNVFVAPGTQHLHPSAVKAWVDGNENATTMAAQYNVASQADTATGTVTYTYTTAFSSANYALVPGITGIDSSPDAANDDVSAWVTSKTTTGCVLQVSAAATPFAPDPGQWYFVACGDQ